jgi:hypothetical protein
MKNDVNATTRVIEILWQTTPGAVMHRICQGFSALPSSRGQPV